MSNYVTAIGLDVHARSIKAFALNPMTGECERASFGYDPAAVAEWALGFESPRCVYESGVTGFHLCRALRALGADCVVGAVSKMQRPAADRGRKNDRRDAEFLARLLATRNVVEVWVPDDRTEAARESAPFPLTRGVPFRHDWRNGERGHGMGHPSPKYSAEFKQQAVRLYRERGGTYAEIARELGVDAGSISDWVRKADAAQASPEDNPFKVAEENRRLRREVERLKRENEILLKASAFFASRQL